MATRRTLEASAGALRVHSAKLNRYSFQISDRTKDVIKSGGEWISSGHLENLLMGHPKVLEAAVVAKKLIRARYAGGELDVLEQ